MHNTLLDFMFDYTQREAHDVKQTGPGWVRVADPFTQAQQKRCIDCRDFSESRAHGRGLRRCRETTALLTCFKDGEGFQLIVVAELITNRKYQREKFVAGIPPVLMSKRGRSGSPPRTRLCRS